MTVTMEDVKNVRREFSFNVEHVKKYITGIGYDMGCGSCPLDYDYCMHFDISPQPLAVAQVGERRFIQCDCTRVNIAPGVDFVFSSHMVEDLESREEIIRVLNRWGRLLKTGGYLILLMPDMQGGRYPKVGEEGGNISHKINVGTDFIYSIVDDLENLELVQMDTIPHDMSCTFDVVFRKIRKEL